MEDLAKRLKDNIFKEGYTIAEFAEEIGYTPHAVWQWCAGQRCFSVGELKRICEYFGWSADELLFGDKYRGW